MEKQIIILAAGKGTRMQSDLPKPMQQVLGKPMLEGVVNAARKVTSNIVLVHSASMLPYLDDYGDCQLVLQENQNGTAHAVYCALDKISSAAFVTIIYADHPFIDSIVIEKVFNKIMTSAHAVVTLASIQKEPNAYGRIIASGELIKEIIEFKDLKPEQQNINLCNSALMAFGPNILTEFLPRMIATPQESEYYLTAIVEQLIVSGKTASYVLEQEAKYSIGVNTKAELASANQL
jgi:UDP-N-acetylglucosamine pyrophosphorylase